MAEFSELIKNFDTIRDYMRDFYIYGFKSRGDFAEKKSARTYDNVKRRCESYLGGSFAYAYSGGSKVSFVSADCGKLDSNPLFNAWKAKSFTDNDVLLHFYLLDALEGKEKSAETLTEEISERCGKALDLQTVRNKCNEYVQLGLLIRKKCGKAYRYALSPAAVEPDEALLDAIKFFQGSTLGVIGRFLLDREETQNDLFLFKHHYIAHTLDDSILLELLEVMHAGCAAELELFGSKSGKKSRVRLVPLKILVSFWSGRRYLCAYMPGAQRFSSFRLDTVRSVTALETDEGFDRLRDALERNLDKVWAVSFEGACRSRPGFALTLHVDEADDGYILDRLTREGRGGSLTRVGENTFRFEKPVFDDNEALPFIKTLIGRIEAVEACNPTREKLTDDLMRMAAMYDVEAPQ